MKCDQFLNDTQSYYGNFITKNEEHKETRTLTLTYNIQKDYYSEHLMEPEPVFLNVTTC